MYTFIVAFAFNTVMLYVVDAKIRETLKKGDRSTKVMTLATIAVFSIWTVILLSGSFLYKYDDPLWIMGVIMSLWINYLVVAIHVHGSLADMILEVPRK